MCRAVLRLRLLAGLPRSQVKRSYQSLVSQLRPLVPAHQGLPLKPHQVVAHLRATGEERDGLKEKLEQLNDLKERLDQAEKARSSVCCSSTAQMFA